LIYLVAFDGLTRCAPEGLVDTCLFKNHRITTVAADLETNLLYFRIYFSNTILIGNEQGEVLRQVSPLYAPSNIFVSCGIILILTSHENPLCFVLKATDGTQMTQVTNQRISRDVCLVHNKGIVVTFNEDQINLWRIV
jgi:hypothetical protein